MDQSWINPEPRGPYARVHTRHHSAAQQRPMRAHQRRTPHLQQAASRSRSPTLKPCAPLLRGAASAARATSRSTSLVLILTLGHAACSAPGPSLHPAKTTRKMFLPQDCLQQRLSRRALWSLVPVSKGSWRDLGRFESGVTDTRVGHLFRRV